MGQWSRFLRLCVVVAIRVRLMNPMRPLKIPLHTKIFLSLTTGLVLCTAVLTATHYRISSRILTAEWESKADEYGRLMEFTFQPLVQSKDRSALNRAISLALLIPGMKSITVIDAQGTIVADSKGQGVGSHLKRIRTRASHGSKPKTPAESASSWPRSREKRLPDR
jgi:hypothetical protein